MSIDEVMQFAERVSHYDPARPQDLSRLRAAVEQHVADAVAMEREECALICDAEGREWDSDAVVTLKNYAKHCAAAIRARADNEVTK